MNTTQSNFTEYALAYFERQESIVREKIAAGRPEEIREAVQALNAECPPLPRLQEQIPRSA